MKSAEQPPAWVEIQYRRLPDRESVFRQRVLHQDEHVVVTLLERARLTAPLQVEGATVLEPGSPVVWFTYPGLWHDVGRFHLADGTFTGLYANVLTPVRMEAGRWRTTDLCLDVWLGVDGTVRTLDEDELEQAEREGWIDPETARRARQEARDLAHRARAGEWPPRHVHEWTLERATSTRTPGARP